MEKKTNPDPTISKSGEEETSPCMNSRLYQASHSSPGSRVKDDIEGKEKRRLRLVIAIPALMVLITLCVGLISYEVVLDMADHMESDFLKGKLEGAANTILLANFIACGIALIFGVGLATYIIRPIRVITQKTRKILSGDLSMKIQISNPDEIGDLGESFNSLVDHLNHLFKERDRYILEGFSEGLISTAAEGEIQAINTQGERILGYRAEQVIGHSVIEILGRLKNNAEINEQLHRSLQDHIRITIDKVPFVNAKGRHFNLSVTSSPIKDRYGNRMGCIIILRDLAILASFSEQLQQADRLAAIGSFATGIAHELRNPLGSIKGVAQLLAENPDSDRNREYTKIIMSEVDRLDRVIRTILDFAQPEPEESIPTSLNAVIPKAIHLAVHNPSVQKNVASVSIDQSLEEIPYCSLQPNRITQALSNIVLNALQNIFPGGKIRVQTRVVPPTGQKDQESLVEVRVVNDGDPIPPENLEKIFEPFFTTRSQGTGLGLPISYQIIISNGGIMEVATEADKTSFIIRFPAMLTVEQTLLSPSGISHVIPLQDMEKK